MLLVEFSLPKTTMIKFVFFDNAYDIFKYLKGIERSIFFIISLSSHLITPKEVSKKK